MSQSLIVTGSVELQLDTLAERVAQRVVELLAPAGSDIYERPGVSGPRTTDSDPGGFPVGRDHPYTNFPARGPESCSHNPEELS